jgi:hypothetical protein
MLFMALPSDLTMLLGVTAFVAAAINCGLGRMLDHNAPLWRFRVALQREICLILITYIGLRVGVTVRDAVFRSRIAQYERAAQEILADSEVNELFANKRIPVEWSSLARVIQVKRASEKRGMVIFYTAGVFPVKHVGYIYQSEDRMDAINGDSKPEFFGLQRVSPRWFRFYD